MLQKYKYHFVMLLAGLSFSGYSIFSGLSASLGIGVFNQIFWKGILGAFSALILALVLQKDKIKYFKLNIKDTKYIIISTLFYFGSSLTFISSIYLGTPIAKATILSYAYPLTIVVFSYFLFKDKPSWKNCLAIVVSLISVLILFQVWEIKEFGNIRGSDILALITSVFFGCVIVWGTKIRKETKLTSLITCFYQLLFSIPLLFVVSLIFNF